jgi:cellulose synthase/poly-beta-1,6-N-acetylglucosamine synthase-like glycosyltransferase
MISLAYIYIYIYIYKYIYIYTLLAKYVALACTINRYEKVLPSIDIFVCTADYMIEPPLMVINTVLSVMAYDYPSEKLSVYLSDDGGSDLTFYAMVEASRFSKIWLPFCKKFNVEPRSPEAYFRIAVEPLGEPAKEWRNVKVQISRY